MNNNNNSFPLPPHGYYMYPPNNYSYIPPQPSSVFCYAHYPDYQTTNAFFRYSMPPQVNNLQISHRRPIKSAQSDAIIIIDDEIPEVKTCHISKSVALTNLKEPKQKQPQTRTLNLTNDEYQYLEKKVCEKCRRVESDDKLLLCDYCDDAYHSYCLGEVLVDLPEEHEIWACPSCRSELEQIEKKEKMERESEIENLRASNNCFVLLDPHFKNLWMKNALMRNNQMAGQINPEFQDISRFQINSEVFQNFNHFFF